MTLDELKEEFLNERGWDIKKAMELEGTNIPGLYEYVDWLQARVLNLEKDIPTVHLNAYMSTLINCIEEWEIDMTNKNYPIIPPIHRGYK